MRPRPAVSVLAVLFVALTAAGSADAVSCTVPTDAGCATVQAALNQAVAGDTVSVNAGIYFEKINFPASGGSSGGYITLQGAPAHAAILDGTNVAGSDMVLIDSRSYVKLVGFEIRNNLKVNDGSGVRILGSASHIEIRDNVVHDVRGKSAMGITVYGTQPASISDLIIDGNEIYDCEPANSETLTLNGNVELFEVTNNFVHDVNNIGIDFIGGERDIQPDTTKVARNGVCRGNRVYRARSNYGGGFAGAIYVDGGRDIVIERNVTAESDLGLEVGAENAGVDAQSIVVRDNILHHNDKAGLVFGGYAGNVGRVNNCSFLNNTLFDNDTLGEGFGELWVQFAANNVVRNNLFVSAQSVVLRSEDGNVNNRLDYNLWRSSAGMPTFVWKNIEYNGLAAFEAGSGQDGHGLSSDPQFVSPATANFHLRSTSPAVNAGDPAFTPGLGETDFDGASRLVGGRVDVGADEITCGDNIVDVGETCDDGNLTDCDGCDSNCTPSNTCGNFIRCGGEQCDDGNTANGDCCSAVCTFEAAASTCDDGDLCTNLDQCDGAGTCSGVAAPATTCRAPTAPLKASVQLRDRLKDALDSLSWRWTKGQLTTSADFGDPLHSTSYALCLYDQSANPQPRLEVAVPPGGSCSARPCWKATSSGFRYASRKGSSSGVRSIVLAQGTDGKARVTFGAKGTRLPLPALGFSPTVSVQLRNSKGGCWGASYSTPSKNDTTQFRAKSD
ncbi:MAG: right-handed parallel beta-helix repeat-containing protein [Deltaproteobacteria bacterium]|nr:right-handed parallel beta-helix repeat-containing protein [Deltaproteobacteria bacterium]